MKDVLIQATQSELFHKQPVNLEEDEEVFWRVSGTPRETEPGRRIWFSYNGSIHAQGTITELEDGRIWFDSAKSTHVPCLDDAPTRGFTYIEPLLPRLEETDWSVEETGEIVIEQEVATRD